MEVNRVPHPLPDVIDHSCTLLYAFQQITSGIIPAELPFTLGDTQRPVLAGDLYAAIGAGP